MLLIPLHFFHRRGVMPRQGRSVDAGGGRRQSFLTNEAPMAMFLTGEAVRSHVDRVIAGDDVRLAVAFWRAGAARSLFDGHPPPTAR